MKENIIIHSNTVKKSLQEFSNLSKACIDSSSIIYMQKSGFLNILSDIILLITIPPVISEIGMSKENIFVYDKYIENAYSTDDAIVRCANILKIPVISDDKKILTNVKKINLPYYNSLMMLNYIVYRDKISTEKYNVFKTRLEKNCYYSEKVFLFAEKLFNMIIQEKKN